MFLINHVPNSTCPPWSFGSLIEHNNINTWGPYSSCWSNDCLQLGLCTMR